MTHFNSEKLFNRLNIPLQSSLCITSIARILGTHPLPHVIHQILCRNISHTTKFADNDNHSSYLIDKSHTKFIYNKDTGCQRQNLSLLFFFDVLLQAIKQKKYCSPEWAILLFYLLIENLMIKLYVRHPDTPCIASIIRRSMPNRLSLVQYRRRIGKHYGIHDCDYHGTVWNRFREHIIDNTYSNLHRQCRACVQQTEPHRIAASQSGHSPAIRLLL